MSNDSERGTAREARMKVAREIGRAASVSGEEAMRKFSEFVASTKTWR